MGVMTSKDMEKSIKAEEAKAAESKPRRNVSRVHFRSAPQGRCNASFFHNGETHTKVLEDGFYVFQDATERKELLDSMLKAGFTIADYWEGEKPKLEKKAPKKFHIRFAHPDNEPNEPKTGNVAIKVGRKDHSFELDEFGTVLIEDEKTQKAFYRDGWVEIEKIEIEE
jgi:hypothetical protein